ncbi:Protein Aster-B [Gonioctena quinquepunctata]|nr:Protein Aster-B [Gonioctena quinquepunctata]
MLIPILTVEDITKEKTARIIPNAVGVSTCEDKHVFGSLMSRDNTLVFMRTVWEKAKTASPVILEPDIDDPDIMDSSESGEAESGRDSPPLEIRPKFSLVKSLAKEPLLGEKDGLHLNKNSRGLVKTIKGTFSEFRKLPRQSLILCATTLLLVLLFFSAGVLLYRIGKIQNKYSLALQDKLGAGSPDIYSDLLQWHSQMHSKSAGAVNNLLDSNLDLIAQVRQSLEALSTLLVQSSNQMMHEADPKPPEANKVDS